MAGGLSYSMGPPEGKPSPPLKTPPPPCIEPRRNPVQRLGPQLVKRRGCPAFFPAQGALGAVAGGADGPKARHQREAAIGGAQIPQPVERRFHPADLGARGPQQRAVTQVHALALFAVRQFGLGQLVRPFHFVARPVLAGRARAPDAGHAVERRESLDQTFGGMVRRPAQGQRGGVEESGWDSGFHGQVRVRIHVRFHRRECFRSARRPRRR
jgi:hypothetical protein